MNCLKRSATVGLHQICDLQLSCLWSLIREPLSNPEPLDIRADDMIKRIRLKLGRMPHPSGGQ
jgi:hypothetical protein